MNLNNREGKGDGGWGKRKGGKRKEERGKRKEERGKRKEERGKRKAPHTVIARSVTTWQSPQIECP
jgi:hypothetical protein